MGDIERYRVGWTAYRQVKVKRRLAVEFIGFGHDMFLALTEDGARWQAVRRVPGRIGFPGCEIGIRYVKRLI